MDNTQVYQRIRKYISERGMRFNSVAEKAGIPQKRFYYLMDGTTALKAEDLANICNALSVSAEYFLSEKVLETKNHQTA